MKRENTSSVGFDRNYKEIFPGDIIQDMHGTRYTITATGLAQDAAGGEIGLSSIHGIELVQDQPAAKDAVAAAPYQKSLAMYGPDLVDEKIRKKTTIGYVAISAIAREIDVPARGCVEAVRAAGIEIRKVNSTSLVRKEDKDAAKTAILAHSEAAKDSPRKTDRPKAKAAKKTQKDQGVEMLKKLAASPDNPVNNEAEKNMIVEIPQEVVEACQENAVVDEALNSMVVDIPADDATLVAELRRRGWTVTCKKMVEVSL
ncbi:MAG: hypothetical protein II008_05750 [Oscillospiraceae bacterium]|nr:hypothetical protein [Oscillospiraceae bacterium]